jgi:molecular chaperone DnaK
MATNRIVGIDLGTTNSLVAFMQGDSPVVIPGEDGLNLVPSVAALDSNGQIIVGNAARKYLIETPDRSVYSIKRLMGRGVEDIQNEIGLFPFRLAEDLAVGEVLRIQLGDKSFTPPEISAYILRHESGHHGSRVLQRRAASGHERCRPHCRPRSSAPGE